MENSSSAAAVISYAEESILHCGYSRCKETHYPPKNNLKERNYRLKLGLTGNATQSNIIYLRRITLQMDNAING